ncbi:fimbria/pilus periplasmic chaperone [Pantoea sp. NPDC088449]|uniref:fimbria/pilus periplasmic chaperone n=1 Tax=Pantoea sp. NPDC088449 TaxID=3364392 RepID=UPI000EDA5907|nr:molecular chaperone [Pantoea sp.]
MLVYRRFITCTSLLIGTLLAHQALAAIAMDRTRVIYNASERSISLNISNENKSLPYLAQSWLEDVQGKKVNSPLLVLPPVQRVEPGQKGAIKIQALPAVKTLPQDRESLFYFNLREIPPRSEKQNVLQIALQTRIKLFYRPAAIIVANESTIPWQNQLTLTQQGNDYKIVNPTPYYITLVGVANNKDAKKSDNGFKPVMLEPMSSATLGMSATALGSHPVLTYINDYGGRPTLTFNCSAGKCTVVTDKKE